MDYRASLSKSEKYMLSSFAIVAKHYEIPGW